MKQNLDEVTITIDYDYYVTLLEERRRNFPARIPDCVWNYFIQTILECGVDPRNSDPRIIVDDIAFNGDFGGFDDYKEAGETDEEFMERVQDEALAIFPEERIVCYSL